MTFQSLKKNPLGLADFRDLLRDDYAYADKTRFIEAIDKINFPFIVRPRRFGKSMFTTMLQAYYDKAATDEFDSNFAGTYIAQHKTTSANQFYVLRLVFSGLGSADHLEEVFQQSLVSQLSDFFETYPPPTPDKPRFFTDNLQARQFSSNAFSPFSEPLIVKKSISSSTSTINLRTPFFLRMSNNFAA